MSAIIAMTDDVRLYSKQPRLPVDVVAPQHLAIHAELERFGTWCRERIERGECESIEHLYDETGGREAKRATIALPPDPRMHEIDRVLRHMRMRMPQHGEALRMFYVGALRTNTSARGLRYDQCAPKRICIVLHLRFEDFGGFMFDCRAAVLNLLRRMAA